MFESIENRGENDYRSFAEYVYMSLSCLFIAKRASLECFEGTFDIRIEVKIVIIWTGKNIYDSRSYLAK